MHYQLSFTSSLGVILTVKHGFFRRVINIMKMHRPEIMNVRMKNTDRPSCAAAVENVPW